jgi:hypothetical protein
MNKTTTTTRDLAGICLWITNDFFIHMQIDQAN